MHHETQIQMNKTVGNFDIYKGILLLHDTSLHIKLLLSDQLDLAMLIIEELLSLDAAQVVLAGDRDIVVEQEPPLLELNDTVMRSPALDGFQNTTSVLEWTVRSVTDGVDKVMGVAGRVAEVVLAVILVHPSSLEEALIVVVSHDRLARLVEQDQLAGRLGNGVHVLAELGDSWVQRLDALAGWFLGPGHLVVELAGLLPALQLSSPQTADVQVGLAVSVGEDGRVDAVGALHVVGVWLEWALWLVGLGDTDAEDSVLVSGGEVEEVLLAVFGHGGVWCPELLRNPG